MDSTPASGVPDGQAHGALELQLREMNKALLISSIRQHELAEQAQKAEALLRESEVRYRQLFQSATDGILMLDATTGRVTGANAVMSNLVGMQPGDLPGKELHEIGLFKDIQENQGVLRELHRSGYLRHDRLPMHNQRGEVIEVEFIANVYHEGPNLEAQCNVRDISQRVVMENRLKEQAEQLAGESRRKDEFLAMLSHELRNPLAPIRSAVHLLKNREQGDQDPLLKQAREIIERQVGNLTRMVNDLLEVSRVVSGRIRLELQAVDVNQVIQHAIDTTRPLIDQRGHELILNRCPDLVWVNADATHLEEVFINVLNNAAKYTPGGGRIEVWCECPEAADFAQVRFRDNGPGIEADLLPRIFDLFTQGDRSLDRAAGGLGVGLSLARRLVELHHGTITAHSPPHGQAGGSEFIVRLPLLSAPPSDAQRSAGPIATSAPRAGGDAEVRVLVVDDNVDQVTMLSGSLRMNGFRVKSAYTGPDGLKIALQWRPEFVLLDIGLPGMDGYEVARRLRAAESEESGRGGAPPLPRMRLIALTGYGLDSDKALAGQAGFDAHLTKPCDLDYLAMMMAALSPTKPTK